MNTTEYGALCALHAQGVIDGKPTTEYFSKGNWIVLEHCYRIFLIYEADKNQWQAIDFLREYKEAFADGKRVEWIEPGSGCLNEFTSAHKWSATVEYRIVEPKTVKLFPFAFFMSEINGWTMAGMFESLEIARLFIKPEYIIAPAKINPDGTIEVEVLSD